MQESTERREHLLNLLRECEYMVVRHDYQDAFNVLEYARQILMAEQVMREHEAMREEIRKGEM